MKQLHNFLSHLSSNDVVNCRLARAGESIEREHRARLVSRTDDGWLVDVGDAGELVEILTSAITRRVQLPWKPSDLCKYLIIFRRRNADKDEYIEDLKVRRALIEELLQILTRLGPWLPMNPSVQCTNTIRALNSYGQSTFLSSCPWMAFQKACASKRSTK